MDDDNETTTLMGAKINDALSAVPEEVQTFMWSDDYKTIVDTIKKTLALTEQEGDLLKYGSYELLLGMKTMEDLAKEWVAAGMKPDLVMKVLYVVHEEILTRAQNITEFYTRNPDEQDNEDDGDEDTQNEIAKTPSLESLSDRLKKASITSPGKRDYGLNKPLSPAESTPSEAKPAIDPYHESIDND